ncbi:autotransporter translocation and assembly factor TamB [Balneicella halophila]|uniref:Autotransporter translocation and assembly factor TamB n=1 Tax=Balneicella halophila TaxID=1537566 RepID=A0A7L4UNT4_BALHA|nr:translocation/assembly module TamB [Balneicella halophila]PVX50850.1 autotransporter translocation and assembly factor TamB [Balneicella halophila]
MKKTVLKIIKIIGYILLTIFALLILAILLLRLPSVQNKVKNYALDFLHEKIDTEVSLEKLYVSFPSGVAIENIYLEDQNADTLLYADKIDVGINLPDLLNNKLTLSSIDMKKLRANVHRNEEGVFNFDYIIEAFASPDTTTTEQEPWEISVGDIDLEDIGVTFQDEYEKNDISAFFQDLEVAVDDFDLENQEFDIDDLFFAHATINVNLFMPEEEITEEEVAEEVSEPVEEKKKAPLTVILDDLELEDVKVQYNNTAIPQKGEGIDFNHLDFQEITLSMKDFKMQDGTFEGEINKARVIEQNHLTIRELETQFKYAKNEAYLKDLLLKTDRSVVRDEVILSYDNMSQLSEDIAKVEIVANIDESKISFADLLDFMPSLRKNPPFTEYPNATLHFDTEIDGNIGDLNIQHLTAHGVGDLQLSANGIVKNATDTDNLYFDLNIENISGSSTTIKKLSPPQTIPDNISLPSKIKLSGTAKGSTKEVEADLALKTSEGDASVLADVNIMQENKEEYDIKLHLNEFNVGKVIQNEELGNISANISAKGKSFDFKNADADLTGTVDSLTYKGYRYENMNLKGKLVQGKYDVQLESKDENANMTLYAEGRITEDKPTLNLKGGIKKLDLQKLNFNEKPLILAGDLKGDFSNINPDDLNGNFSLTNFALSDAKDVYPLQDIHLNAVATDDSNTISLTSQIAEVELSGDYKLTEIFTALTHTLNSYYQFQEATAQDTLTPHQHMDFDIRILYDDLVEKFVPNLKGFETMELQGSYDVDSQLIKVDGEIPNITYGNNHIENGKIAINTDNDALTYELLVEMLYSESFQLHEFSTSGQVASNTIDFKISTEKPKGTTELLLAGDVKAEDDGHYISLDADGVKLNTEKWNISEKNFIKLEDNGTVTAENFKLTNGDSALSLETSKSETEKHLKIDFVNFDVATLTKMIQKDKLLASGTTNGSVTFEDLQQETKLKSDLEITDLHIYEQLVGTIDAEITTESANVFDINVALSDNDNDVKITGDYNTSSSSFDLLVDMRKLQMQSLEGVSMGQIKETEGYLSGKLDVEGSATEPKITGQVKFNDVGLKVVQSGSNFRNINEEVRFTQQGIVFNDFKLNDESGDYLLINGKILTDDYRDYAFDLRLEADDFKVVDSEEDNDQMMYGVLAIDTRLNIGGDLNMPKVDGTIDITDVTDFTFVLPQDSPTLEEREGIVRFVDKDLPLKETLKPDSLTSETNLKGMDVKVEISITEDAKISLIIDKATGDFVKLQGDAELSGGIDPSGKTTLVGVYEVSDGAYELNLGMLNRKFDIKEGSTIIWNGEPLSAEMDITANYRIEAAPIDLLQHQLSGLPPSTYNTYKQRIPFNTLLMMKGDLMKPDIQFDINVDEEEASVSSSVLDNTKTKLQQIRQNESELNKQVFALLLLNRFIGENPFSSESETSAGTMARQSVSRILSQQLNNLASDLITGVDVDFDFNSYDDYTQGHKNTRTDLNLGVSKRLLNDRLKITVGSKFGIEGEARKNEELTNIAGDLTIDYMLSKNGRYLLRAFRKNDYEVVLQGQIIETGLGFIITLDFDEFRDIFHKSKEKKEED